jgi:steroid 5-alpha reductase family enzyme
MKEFLILLLLALLASSCGFRKYVWFISLGYGAAVALVGAGLLYLFSGSLSAGTILQCVLFIVYGCRLSGYLAYRDLKTAYTRRMKGEVKSDKSVSFAAKVGIWISAAVLYVLQTSPVLFRLQDNKGTDAPCLIGFLISLTGLLLETTADLQKNRAKKKNPGRFVDTGLFRLVRCPNYFGEMIFWTGVFISGLNVYHTAAEWICSLLGYAGIIYVMFGGARRLEIRQDKNYGNDPEYRKYKSTTPIMIPFLPIYSVKEHKWLVA